MSDSPVRARVIVHGRVQGVYFRASTQRAAQRLGVAGWVRNLPDGSVEAVFEGSAAAVGQAVAWSADGPERAHVETIETTAEDPEGLDGFRIR